MLGSMDERLSILKMVEENKISAEQGVQLLSALGQPKAAPAPVMNSQPAGEAMDEAVVDEVMVDETTPEKSFTGKGRWFRVMVTDTNTGKNKVSVRLPMRMVQWGLKVGSRYTDELEGLDFNELAQALSEEGGGPLVDVIDEEDGEHVQVFVE